MPSTPQQDPGPAPATSTRPGPLTCEGCTGPIAVGEMHIRQDGGPDAPAWHDDCLPAAAIATGQHLLTGFPR
jgi:hypothetical protein